MKSSRSFVSPVLLAVVAALVIAATPAVKSAIPAIKALLQSPSDGIFEIDDPAANAVDDAVAGDDWQTLAPIANGGLNRGNAQAFTGFLDDFCNASGCDDVFTGGSKDILDIDQWTVDPTFNAPDKNEIVNAYAAQYIRPSDDHLILTFGMDRLDASGDAEIGFWFLQGVEYDKTTGAFTSITGGPPKHVPGDTLVLSHFSNGGGVVTIQVYEWVGGSAGDEDCGPGVTASPLNCLNPGPDALAVVNSAPITAYWNTANKSGGITECLDPPCTIQTGNFFEGSIDLTGILGTNECFTTFLAESRSSTSVTAELKDVVGGSFKTCAIGITKVATPDAVCKDCNGTPATTTYSYEICNEGVTTLNINVVDDNGTPGNTADDIDVDGGPGFDLAAGDCEQFTLPNHVLPDLGEAPYVITNTVTATGTAGTATVIDSATADVAVADCEIEVTKDCVLPAPHAGEPLNFEGTVTNTGDAALTGVTVTDDHAGVVLGPVDLAAGQTLPFTGSYPAVLPTDPPCESTNTVTATGTVVDVGCVVSATDNAVCDILIDPSLIADVNCTNVSAPGESTTITGTVTNDGDVTLVDVEACVSINGGACVPVNLSTTTLAPGAFATIVGPGNTFVPVLDSDCVFTVDIEASATPDPNCDGVSAGSITDEDSTTCTITTDPSLDTEVFCTNVTAPGGSTTITGSVTNDGNVPLVNVAATVSINGGAFVPVTLNTTSLAVGASASIVGGNVFVPPLDADCVFDVDIQATANPNPDCGAPTQVTDPSPDSTSCTIGTDPEIDTFVECTNVSEPGGSTTITGTVTNTGNVTLNNVTACVSINGGACVPVTLSTTTLAANGVANIVGGNTFVPPLDSDCTFTVELQATGVPTDACGGPSTISDLTPDTTSCTIATDPSLDTSVECTNVTAPGGSTTITGSVTNDGNVPLANVVAEVSINGGPFVPVTLNTTSLAVGASATITGGNTFFPALDADCTFTVDIQATANPNPDCGSPTEVSDPTPDSTSCTIDTNPDLEVTVECTDSTGAGQPITITGTVTNNGNVEVTGIDVDITANLNLDVFNALTGITLGPGDSEPFSVPYLGLTAGQCSTFTADASGTANRDCDGLGAGGVTATDTTPVPCCVPGAGEGCTPGYWKNHAFAWNGTTGPDPNDVAAEAGFEDDTLFFTFFSGITINDIAPQFQVFYPPTLTMQQALGLGGGNPMKMTRHTIAALLNLAAGLNYAIPDSCTQSGAGPCIDAAGIKAEFEARIKSKIYSPFASDLANANQDGDCPCNNQGCP